MRGSPYALMKTKYCPVLGYWARLAGEAGYWACLRRGRDFIGIVWVVWESMGFG